MLKITACHIIDHDNIGDMSCCPMSYVNWPGCSVVHRDVRDPAWSFAGSDAVIFGGGGMLHRGVVEQMRQVTKVVKGSGGKTITWGIGSNDHGMTRLSWPPDLLKQHDLVGVRDANCPIGTFVPCPSCLSPQFDDVPDARHDVVVYEHHQHPIESFAWNQRPACTMQNNVRSLEVALRFIASGKLVITNTYHGAYWAMLMCRPVLVWKPFSSRFYGFSNRMTYVDETNWEKHRHRAQVFPSYLKRCRDMNRAFERNVCSFLKV